MSRPNILFPSSIDFCMRFVHATARPKVNCMRDDTECCVLDFNPCANMQIESQHSGGLNDVLHVRHFPIFLVVLNTTILRILVVFPFHFFADHFVTVTPRVNGCVW